MARYLLGLLATVCVLAFALPVRAEHRPSLLADHRPGRRSAALEFDLGYRLYSGAQLTAHFLTPSLDFRYAFSDHAELTFDWPFAFAAVAPDVGSGESSFKSGNPAATLYYVGQLDQGYFRIGGGVGLPVAHLGDNVSASAIAYGGAIAMNGLYDAYRYTPDTLSLLLPAQLEFRRGALVIGGDASLIVMIPTGDNRNETDVVLQLGGLIGGRIDNVTVGTRLQVAWVATGSGDNAQAALVPFVQADFSGGGFFYARLLLNLDQPFGLFGDRNGVVDKVWGLFLGGGSRF